MYLIGIDGGGTKTDCIVTGLEEGFVSSARVGPASLRDLGVEKTIESVANAVKSSLEGIPKEEITVLFVGLSGFAEEFKDREEEIKMKIKKELEDSGIKAKKIQIDSDQKVAFRAGTNEKDGVIAIAGTGSVVRGWNNEKDIKVSGWGFFADDSGAFYIGKEAYKKTAQMLDGRIEKTVLADKVLEFFNAKNINDINKIIYQKDFIKAIAPLSIVVNEIAESGEEFSVKIIDDASKNLAFSTIKAIEKLEFNEEFPLVIVGGMFKSKLFYAAFKEEVLKNTSNANIVIPQEKIAVGAVKIAKEIYENDLKE